jgi:hypothetical protein
MRGLLEKRTIVNRTAFRQDVRAVLIFFRIGFKQSAVTAITPGRVKISLTQGTNASKKQGLSKGLSNRERGDE